MANVFITLPAPAGNGAGAWVDCSAQGAERDIVVGGTTVATVTIEISNEAAASQGAPVASFQLAGKGGGGKRVVAAAVWMRAVVNGYQSGGAPTVNVGANDDGTSRANLAVTAGDGTGAATDVSALPLTKTVTVGGPFKGTVLIEYSEDGTDYAPLTVMIRPGQITQRLAADFMRVVRKGVPVITPGLPIVNVGACEDTSTDPTFVDVVISDSLDLEGRLLLSGDNTPAALAADANNYAPAGFSTTYTLRLAGTALRSITGIAGGAGGRRIRLVNVGSFDLVLNNESGSSTAANRFKFSGARDFRLEPGDSVELQYDATDVRWRRCEDWSQYGGGVGTLAEPTFKMGIESSGMYLPSAGNVGFAVAATQRVNLNSTALATLGNTGLSIGGAWWTANVVSPAQITANQNDYNPTGAATAAELRINSDAARNITGVVPGAAPTGRRLRIVNVGSFAITLQNENAGSAAANRFHFATGDVILGVDAAIEIDYDGTTTRWRAVKDQTQYVALIGSSTNPAFTFSQEPASGFYLIGGSQIGVSTAALGATFQFAATNGTLNGSNFSNSGGQFYTGIITPTALVANTNNYGPTGNNARVWRISATGAVDLTGMVPFTGGQEVVLINIGANAITLKDESASSTAGNRFALIADIILLQDATATVWYDATTTRWRCTAKNVT